MAGKKEKFSFKKLFFMKSFFGSLVGKIELSDKPLNWLSIVFLIAFDIFIFSNLVDWLDNQRQHISSPYEKYTYDCKQLFNVDWDFKSNDFRIISNNYSNNTTKNINAPFYDESFSDNEKSEFCKNINDNISNIKNNSSFNSLYKELNILDNDLTNLENKKYNYEKDYIEFRDDYSAWLGWYDDRISDINNNSVRIDYARILSSIDRKLLEIKLLENKINNLTEVVVLKNYINSNKNIFIAEESHYSFWYPVYVTLMEAILILPILLFTVLLYNFAIKRKLRILSILASNLALIAGLFSFYILIKVVYWVLPKKFFANLITYLASIKALAIWNYLLTIFGLILFWALMFGSQKSMEKYKKIKEQHAKEKELLNKERIGKERYWNKTCIDCNTKLLDWATHCSNCWVEQYKECFKCKNRMPKAYSHCEKCWTTN